MVKNFFGKHANIIAIIGLISNHLGDKLDKYSMRAHELITEMATSVLFHYTSTKAACEIVTNGVFSLSSTVGNKSEQDYAPPGYPYFLSLTRTSLGDYHNFVGSGGTLFKLNGGWFNSRYPVKPIDYWAGAWQHSNGTRTREAEDRVFSKTPTIPATAIAEIYVLIKEQNEHRSPWTRKLMFVAKQRQLPVYLFTDEKSWKTLDKRKAVSPSEAKEFLKGAPYMYKHWRKPADYVKPWLELIYKTDKAHLSPSAERKLRDVVYYGYDKRDDSQLGNDLSNARKPDAGDRASAVELITYMQKHGYGSDTIKLRNALKEKWDKILAAKP